MNKAALVESISEKAGLSKKDAEVALGATLQTIEEALVKGDSVNFIGFGSFSTTNRAARQAKVPGTDKIVQIPETRAVKFKVGKKLKDAVAK